MISNEPTNSESKGKIIYLYLTTIHLVLKSISFGVVSANIVELKGDLFSVANDFALAHCVSADMAMGKGIAVMFRDKFKNIENLKKQGNFCIQGREREKEREK